MIVSSGTSNNTFIFPPYDEYCSFCNTRLVKKEKCKTLLCKPLVILYRKIIIYTFKYALQLVYL